MAPSATDGSGSSRRPGKGAQLLAKQILDVIQDARFDVGHHLREQHLADTLGVSRTPVRAAMQQLAKLGVLTARPNQGFFLAQPAHALRAVVLDVPPSNDEELYDRLVKDRLAGAIPVSITQTEIAQRYGADRMSMTRVLARLSEDGLILRNRGQGWRFQPSFDSATTLRSSYDYRLTMEPAALLLPTFSADRSVIERCRREHIFLTSRLGLEGASARQLFDTDAQFHELLAECSGNVFMHQAMQQQNRLRRLFEFRSYVNRRRIREWCSEHIGILEAILDNDACSASQRMLVHLQHAFGATAAPPDIHRVEAGTDDTDTDAPAGTGARVDASGIPNAGSDVVTAEVTTKVKSSTSGRHTILSGLE